MDWQIVADCGNILSFYAWMRSDTSRYDLMRFAELWYGNVAGSVKVSLSGLIRFDSLIMFWYEFLNNIPSWISIWSEHLTRVPNLLRLCRCVRIRFDKFITIRLRSMGHNNAGDSLRLEGDHARFELRFDKIIKSK